MLLTRFLLVHTQPSCTLAVPVVVVFCMYITVLLFLCSGSLRGVEVCGETMFEVVGGTAQVFPWTDYGFRLEVPEGALPSGVTAVVAVKAIVAGQFQLPKDSELISAVYWVSSSHEFLEEVTVQIEHCAVIRSVDECPNYKFIIARCNQPHLPYHFKDKEGLFSLQSQLGSIKVKCFSIFGTIRNWFAPREYNYCSQLLSKTHGNTRVDYVYIVYCDLRVKEKV